MSLRLVTVKGVVVLTILMMSAVLTAAVECMEFIPSLASVKMLIHELNTYH